MKDIRGRKNQSSNKVVVVIGLDGATFDVLLPLMKSGRMPTLHRLMNKGVHGTLHSCIPPVTTPAWKCYSTGKNPGKLGVSTEVTLDQLEKKIHYVNSTSFHSKEIWDILGEHGQKSVVVNMPLSFPLKRMNGILVSGIDTPSSAIFSYPREIMTEIIERVGPYEPWASLREIFLSRHPFEETKLVIESRFSALDYLIDRIDWDFFHGTIFLCDQVQHYFWNEKSVLSDMWQFIDKKLGELLSKIRETANRSVFLFLISDHGFGPVKGAIYIGDILASKGFLRYENRFRCRLLNLAKEKIQAVTLYVVEALLRHNLDFRDGLSRTLLRKWLLLVNEIFGEELRPDWEKSKIIMHTDGISAALYVNANNVGRNETRKLKDDIVKELEVSSELEIYDRSEIYSGEYLESCPDLIVLSKGQQRVIRNWRSHSKDLFCTALGIPLQWTGVHRIDGIFIAHGPDIRRAIVNASIFDIAPTIMHILGVPIPLDVDGKVLKQIFKRDSELFQKEIIYQELAQQKLKARYSEAAEKMVRDRLRQLGYI